MQAPIEEEEDEVDDDDAMDPLDDALEPDAADAVQAISQALNSPPHSGVTPGGELD